MVSFSYGYVVEIQPIGKLLFEDFCRETYKYDQCYKFLQRIEDYETCDDDGETRRTLARSIADSLLHVVANGTDHQPCVSCEKSLDPCASEFHEGFVSGCMFVPPSPC